MKEGAHLQTLQNKIPLSDAIIGTLIGAIGFLSVLGYIKLQKKNFLLERKVTVLIESTNNNIQRITKFLLTYLIVAIVITIFVGFSTQTLTIR